MMADAVATPVDPATFAGVIAPAAAAVATPNPTPGQASPNVVNVHYPAQTGTITPPPAGPAPLPTTVIEQLQAYGALQARVAQMEAEGRTREENARAEQVKLLAAKGQVEEAFAMAREQAKKDKDTADAARLDAESRAKRYALTGELARSLAEKPLVPGGAEQLTKLWQDQFVVDPQGDSFQVRHSQTFQPVGEFIGAMLGRPEYTHYLRPTTSGGVGAPGASATSPTPAAQTSTSQVEPKDIGEALILKAIAARQAIGQNANLTGGSQGSGKNVSAMEALPFGLHRTAQ